MVVHGTDEKSCESWIRSKGIGKVDSNFREVLPTVVEEFLRPGPRFGKVPLFPIRHELVEFCLCPKRIRRVGCAHLFEIPDSVDQVVGGTGSTLGD